MTNEEMITLINEGKTELLNDLIRRNKSMIHRIAYKYKPLAERNGGADINDLVQSATLGLLEAVPYWEPERGGFLTLAMFYIRKSIRELLGLNTTKERAENTGRVISLNAPIRTEDSDDLEIGDTIPDEHAEELFESVEEEEIKRVVRAAVDSLPIQYKHVITAYYFEGKTYTAIGGNNGKSSYNQARRLCSQGLRRLRRIKSLRWLYEEYERPAYSYKGITAFNSSGTSSVEDSVIRRESLRKEAERLIKAFPPGTPENDRIRELKNAFKI